ncbi:MAG: FAD-dependent oxidoreductase [Candidatus Omnitrophica bacterium]|nr:FAD-dependent oxidoreductase [Candidatus Omnitrophota bacterium]
MYDLIIVGAGPAGITASIYAARKKIDFLVISEDVGGQAALSWDVENYTGYQFITGPELADKFQEHLDHYKIALRESESVKELSPQNNIINIKTDKGTYQAKTCIIASGKRSRELNVPGEKEFKNKGLTYCATCDGPLFSGKDVVIIGGGNSALDAALGLLKIANKIFIVNDSLGLHGDQVLMDKVSSHEKVTVLNSSSILGISGDRFVSGIKIRRNDKEEEIKVQGVFVEIGLIPNSEFTRDIAKNEKNEIIVDCENKTNAEGVYAAGDVTNVVEKQIIIAAGEGSKAALSVFKYLSRIKE